MDFLYWAIIGLIAGAIAKAIRPGRDPQGCIVTMIIGVIGSILGGWIAQSVLGWEREGNLLYNLLIATGGAVIVLAIWAAVSGRRRDV